MRAGGVQEVMGKKTRCGAARCGEIISATKMFCVDHWKQLPEHIQDEIYGAYRKRDRIRSLELCLEANRALQLVNG